MNLDELFSVKGKVAVVTGGSRGLGRTLALALGQAGARVAIFARNQADLERTRDTLIELIETVRSEACGIRGSHHLPGRPPGPSRHQSVSKWEAGSTIPVW